MYFAFNELSMQDISNPDIDLGRECFSNYIRFLSKIKKACRFEGIVAHEKPWNYLIAKDYSIYNWMHDQSVDRELKRYANSILNECVVIEQFEGDVYLKIKPSVVSKGGTAVKETPEVVALYSFLANDLWKSKALEAKYESLNNDGNIGSEDFLLTNYNAESCFDEIVKEDRDVMYKEIASTSDLWSRRNELFPNLIFCDSVKKQLDDNPGRVHALGIIRSLKKVQEYFEKEHDVYVQSDVGVGVRTESETVKSNTKLKAMRLFRLPSGEEVYFWEHFNFTGQFVGRIYIMPDVKNKRAYVGYIGHHLPTKNF